MSTVENAEENAFLSDETKSRPPSYTEDNLIDIVQLLVSVGVAVDARRQRGLTALHICCLLGQLSIASKLLSPAIGSDINAVNEASVHLEREIFHIKYSCITNASF